MSTSAPNRPKGVPPAKGPATRPGFVPRTAADHLPRSEEQPRSVGRGLLALLGLVVLVVGVPVGLVLWVGNPLPSSLPTTEWLTARVTSEALINIFAVLVWLVWAHFVVCLLAEWRAVRAGRMPHLVPAGGGSQLLARRLIAGVLLLAGSATMTGSLPGQAGAPNAAVVSTDRGASSEQAGSGELAHEVQRSTLGGDAAAADSLGQAGLAAGELVKGAATAATTDRAEAPVTKFYEVQPPQGRNYDTLWDIADRTLGDPFRYKELYQLNADRVQPDGRRLVDADLIHPGWQLVMPADATGPDITSVRAQLPFTSSPSTPEGSLAEAGDRAAVLAADASGAAAGALAGAAGAEQGMPSTADGTDGEGGVEGAGGGVGAAGAGAGGSSAGAADVPVYEDVLPGGSGGADLGDLALGGGMVLAGLALALTSRRGPYGGPTEEEQALRLAANPGRADLLDRALRLLSEGRIRQGLPLPDAAAVYVNDEQVIVHLAGTGHGQPPPPWQSADEGEVWVLKAADIAGLGSTAPAPWPALVNVAVSHGFDLLVDLEYAPGLVSIGGAPDVARQVALSTVVDLVTHPWSDGVQVTLVGFAGDESLAGIAPGRVRHVTSIEEALDDAQREAADHAALVRGLGVEGVLAGRAAGSGGALRPHVLVLSGNPSPEQAQRLTDLLSRGRTGLAAVCVGQTLAARWRFGVDSSGVLNLGVLGLSGTARQLRHEDLDRVARWVRLADEDAAEATATAAALSPAAAVATLPAEGTALLRAADAMGGRDTALAHVGLLGPVVVHAPGEVNPAREELLTELVTLVALHPEGVHDSVLRVSLWPRGVDDDVVQATLAAAIRWLGTDHEGRPLLHTGDDGRWRLSSAVHVDWLELAAVARNREDDRHRITDVLGQGRGEAFSGTPAGRYSWLAFHQTGRDARVVLTALTRRAAAAHAAAGDRKLAETTLRQGLELVPRAQALWRDLLRLLGDSDPGSAGVIVEQLQLVLGADPLEPETLALVQHLAPGTRQTG